jgi:hypothetical protein
MYDSRSWNNFCDTMDAIRRLRAGGGIMYDSRSWNNFCDTMDAIRREQAKLKKRNEKLAESVKADVRKHLEARREKAVA